MFFEVLTLLTLKNSLSSDLYKIEVNLECTFFGSGFSNKSSISESGIVSWFDIIVFKISSSIIT